MLNASSLVLAARRNVAPLIVAALLASIAACGVAFAQGERAVALTPSPPGSEVYFIDLKTERRFLRS